MSREPSESERASFRTWFDAEDEVDLAEQRDKYKALADRLAEALQDIHLHADNVMDWRFAIKRILDLTTAALAAHAAARKGE
jgi:hypothetical protein